MQFDVEFQDKTSNARAGKILTDHGSIPTPVFMPVGTAGTVKAIHNKDLNEQVDARIILGNTYHLYLRPGLRILEKAGGLHRFNSWQRPILTDSGGYQVYSLAHRRKLTEQGVVFQSHIDGSRHTFTPENVMDIQRVIGGDIIMAFDECTPFPCKEDYATDSMHLTHRWLDRCCNHFDNTENLYGYRQTLFPIVQGSTFPDLRKQSAEFIASREREGNAIGGLSVGEPAEMMYEMTDLVCQILPADKPRYLMGVGTPANLLECIALGVDMFDCVMPTRNARNGMIFTFNGIMNMKNKKWEDDFSPLDTESTAFTGNMYSRAYLRHLFAANEMLASIIATMHNLNFYQNLMKKAREQIINGTFASWKNKVMPGLTQRL